MQKINLKTLALSASAGMTIFFLPPTSRAAMEHVQVSSGKTILAVSGQVLVRYKSGAEARGHGAVVAMGGTEARTIPGIGVKVVRIPPGESVQAFLQKLSANPDIEYAEPNGVIHAVDFPKDPPNDPDYSSGSSNYQYALQQINAAAAWSITTGTASVIVAVVDTGVTLTHPDLCTSTSSFVSGSDSGPVCLDGNIWVNPSPDLPDFSGPNGTRIPIVWDSNGCTATPENDPSLGCGGSGDCVGPAQCASASPMDDDAFESGTPTPVYHGTHVSGIIAALTNNGENMAGICPNCRIMGVKVLNSWGTGSFSAIAEGITYAADHGAAVINLSLGAPPNETDQTVTNAINYALGKNVVVVAAAGNDANNPGTPAPIDFPASVPKVIAVGATDQNEALAYFSCTGNSLGVVAPGVNIDSLTPPNASNNALSGTSFSSPMVAGVAALVKSINPNFTPSNVTQCIEFSATHVPGQSGFSPSFGFGLVNAGGAVTAAETGCTVPITNPVQPDQVFSYPNPYHPKTDGDLNFSIPSSLGTDGIEITIFDFAGEKVRTLDGTNTWDGRNDNGSTVASGLYFYYLKTSQGNVKGKITVIR